MDAQQYMEEVKVLEFKDSKTLIKIEKGQLLEKENFTAEYPDDGLTITDGSNSFKVMGSRWTYLPNMVNFKIQKISVIDIDDKVINIYKPLVENINDIYVKIND